MNARNNPPAYYRSILDTMPIPVLVVDRDLRIHDYNPAAGSLLADEREQVLRHRSGDIMHCLHSLETPAGCGHSEACRSCVIRGSVAKTVKGSNTSRRKTRMEFHTSKGVRSVDMLVTTSPLDLPGRPLVLLVLEDVTELTVLRGLLPICARCKSIRDDRQFWQRIETYLHEHLQLDFSHGLCPKCMEELYPEIYRKISSRLAAPAEHSETCESRV